MQVQYENWISFSHTLNIFPVRKKIPVVQDNCYSMALSVLTVFENQQNMSHLNSSILAFFTNFCFTFKIDLSGNTVWQRVSDYQKIAKFETIFGLFNELLSTQNFNVARFARNVEWDFFCDFQTLCHSKFLELFGTMDAKATTRRSTERESW